MIFLAFLKCLRPKQWIKNLLIFAGLIFAQKWGDQQLVVNSLIAFAVFCALSGVVYITNDILDADKDRLHPKKRKRPIASGAISPTAAGIGAVILLVAALIAAWGVTFHFFVTAVVYVALVSAYSFKFKHVVILDIMLLAMGFVVRAIAGIEAINVDPANDPISITPFFILTTLFLALFLAIAKRRNEMVVMQGNASETRRVLADYSTEYLDVLLTVATTGVITSYAAWATIGGFAKIEGNYTMVFTMPFVLYGIFRYLWLVFRRDEGGAPEELLFTDKPLLASVALWMITVVAILA